MSMQAPQERGRGRRSVATTQSRDTNAQREKEKEGSSTTQRQTVEERRQVRREYRKLLDDLDEHKQELIRPESDALEEKMKRGNEIYSQVTMPREAALDSEFLSATSQLGLEQVNRLHTHFKTYDATTFIQKARRVLLKKDPRAPEDDEEEAEEEQELDWDTLGKISIKFFHVTPTVDFMYGPLSVAPKEKKARARAQKEELGKKVVPEEVKNTEVDAEEETSKRVEKMAKSLQSVESKKFFEFIADPDSFSQTVENLFHLSFLIKEGRAGLDISKIDGTPVLRPTNPPDDKDYDRGQAQKKQCVIRLDFKMFQDIQDVFGIKRPFLEHRPSQHRALVPEQTNGIELSQRKRKGGLEQSQEKGEELSKKRRAEDKGKGKEKETDDSREKEREEAVRTNKRKRDEQTEKAQSEKGQAAEQQAKRAKAGRDERTEKRKETAPAKTQVANGVSPATGRRLRMEIDVKVEPGTKQAEEESSGESDSGTGSSSEFSDSESD